MPRFEGCVEAREISLTRKGANQHAHVLIRKSAAADGSAQPKTEKTQMATEAEKAAAAERAAEINKSAMQIANKIAGMSDVTKSYYLGLAEDAQVAFLAKSADDQKAEAETAKAEADRRTAEEEAAKSGKTTREVELERRLADSDARIADLEKARVESELEKRANTEFDGYPGGVAVVLPLLKSFSKLPEAERTAAEEVLKAAAKSAKEATKTIGARTDGVPATEVEAAKKRIDDATEAYAKEHNVSKAQAFEKVVEKREFAADAALIG